jgi:hypothetical protein
MRTGGSRFICEGKERVVDAYIPVALIDGAAARSLPHSFLSRNWKIGVWVDCLRIDRLRSRSGHGEGHGDQDVREEGAESHVDLERGCFTVEMCAFLLQKLY